MLLTPPPLRLQQPPRVRLGYGAVFFCCIALRCVVLCCVVAGKEVVKHIHRALLPTKIICGAHILTYITRGLSGHCTPYGLSGTSFLNALWITNARVTITFCVWRTSQIFMNHAVTTTSISYFCWMSNTSYHGFYSPLAMHVL